MNLEEFDWGIMEGYELKPLLIEEIFKNKIYNRHFQVEPGDTVVDVGASVGPFVYSIMDCKPSQVYAIEPSKTEFPTLVKNTRGYPVSQINKAIWEGDGITNQIDAYYSDSYVETMKFKTFRELYDIQEIDFLKTDCEGGEYHIFNEENIDFIKNHVHRITGEWHLETPERKALFRTFRDKYIPLFNEVYVYSVDGIDIKWDLYNDHFIEYYAQVIIHMGNSK